MHRLTEAQRRRYRTEGITFPVPVLSPAEVQYYRTACDELETYLGGKPRTIEVRQMHLHFRWAYELATHPRLLDAVEDLLGPDLLIWATELFAKHPNDMTVSIHWHRDQPYMGFATGMAATAWIALADSEPANGCMRAVPKSAEEYALAKETGSNRPSGELPASPPDDRHVLDVVLRAGEMSVHDVDVLHGSGANHSAEKRVGFVVRFLTPETRPLIGRPPVLLAQGHDRYHHFDVVEPPTIADTGSALAVFRESAAQHLEGMLRNLKHVQR